MLKGAGAAHREWRRTRTRCAYGSHECCAQPYRVAGQPPLTESDHCCEFSGARSCSQPPFIQVAPPGEWACADAARSRPVAHPRPQFPCYGRRCVARDDPVRPMGQSRGRLRCGSSLPTPRRFLQFMHGCLESRVPFPVPREPPCGCGAG